MSKETAVNQLRETAKSLIASELSEFDRWEIDYPDTTGMNVTEAKRTTHFILNVLRNLLENDAWAELPYMSIMAVEPMLQSLRAHYQAWRGSPDQNSFMSFANQLDSVAYHLRVYSMVSLASDELAVERNLIATASELDKLINARTEFEQIQKEVKVLIEPAVAGSLSQAFTSRKTTLLIGRIVWGVIALVAGYYAISATYKFTNLVGSAILVTTKSTVTSEVLWATVMIRSVVLFPLYAAFGFSFSQYRKERDFEEEYAHKAAVATSLPNYGDLTREPSVRDQIVTGATNVIFSAPTSNNNDQNRSDAVLGTVKELFDSVAKLVPRKGD